MNKTIDFDAKKAMLRDRMFKLLCNKPYSANRNHVNNIAEQIKYIENQHSRNIEE